VAIAKPLHLRLFLEGIEVPVISAHISINTNAPASASVQIIPLDSAQDLKPRTMVHLFFLDTENVLDKDTKDFVGVRGTYRLLFSGEAIGFSVVQTPQSRGFILQCVDFSNYWDSAHATAISYGVAGNLFSDQSALSGSDSSLFDDIANFPAERLVQWLRLPPGPKTQGLETVGGLAGGIIKIMEAMGGVWPHFAGVNDFFTVAELRCKLLQQITAEENDNTAATLLAGSVFMEWLKNGLQCAGGQITFRDMMLLLFKYIYYEFVPNPAAKFDNLSDSKKSYALTIKLAEYKSVAKVIKELKSLAPVLTSLSLAEKEGILVLVVQECSRFIAILENVKSVVAVESTALQDAKTLEEKIQALEFAKEADTLKASRLIRGARSEAQAMLVNSMALDALTVKNKLLEAAQVLFDSEQVVRTSWSATAGKTQRLKAQIVRPDCWFSPPPKCNVIFPEQYASLNYDRNWLAETTRVLVQEFSELIGSHPLLNSYFLAPAFGSNSADLNKTDMKGEASYRYLLPHEVHTGILPKSEWLTNTSAINAKVAGGRQIKSARGSWIHRAALFHFYKYRFGPRQASVAGRFNPFVVCGFPALVIQKPYLVSVGKLKNAARLTKGNDPLVQSSEELTDRRVIDLINEFAVEWEAPAQLVGQVAGVSHSLDQSGGTTSISMHHVRRHIGTDDDFLSTFLETDDKVTRIIKTVITYETVEKMKGTPRGRSLLSLLIGVTPQGAVPKASTKQSKSQTKVPVKKTVTRFDNQSQTMVEVQANGNMAPAKPIAVEQKLPDFCKKGEIPKARVTNAWVPSKPGTIGVGAVGKGIYPKSTIIGIEVLPSPATTARADQPPPINTKTAFPQRTRSGDTATGPYVFQEVAIYEEVNLVLTGRLPIEEVIRPAWFSAAYRNDRIGSEIYETFFGCGSIIDQLMDLGGYKGLDLPTAPGMMDIPSVDADVDPKAVIAALNDDEARRTEVSIEKAANLLAFLYAQVKTQGQDVDDFIRSYINRPIATLDEILGEDAGAGLNFTVDAEGKAEPVKRADGSTPMVGFHSTAVHPDLVNSKTKYAGLMSDPSLNLKRMEGGKTLPISLDIRFAKRDKVEQYAQALNKDRAFRG
jgi:hypothetical protein